MFAYFFSTYTTYKLMQGCASKRIFLTESSKTSPLFYNIVYYNIVIAVMPDLFNLTGSHW